MLRCICNNIDDPTATEIPGCSAIYASDYDRFEPFFGAVLAKLRGANCLLHDCNKKLPSGWSNINDANNTGALDVSKLGLPALQITCTIRRNLNDLSLLISSNIIACRSLLCRGTSMVVRALTCLRSGKHRSRAY